MEASRRIFFNRRKICALFGRFSGQYRQLRNQIGRQVQHGRGFVPAKLAAFSLIPTVSAAWGFGSKATQEDQSDSEVGRKADIEELIENADELYARNEILLLYDLLIPHKDCENDEILWRLCRAACDKAKLSSKPEVKKMHTYEAADYIKKALTLNDRNFAVHKWYAIMLDYTGEYEGTKQRLSNAYQVKEHFLKAIEINPKDATSVYSLGYWCFLFADLPWYQQKVASMIFTAPPKSSYDEALKYFADAENMDPNFYSMNHLMLGKTYSRLGNTKMALLYLTKAREYHVKTEDDKKAHKEAVELLKSMGVKDVE